MWISAWQYIGDIPQTGDPVLEPSQPGPWYTYTESAILEIISLHINVKGWTWRVDLSDIQTFRLQLSRKTSKTLVRLVLPVSVRLVLRWLQLTLHFTRLHHFCAWCHCFLHFSGQQRSSSEEVKSAGFVARIVGQSKPDQKSCWMNPPAMQCLVAGDDGETSAEREKS